MAILLRRLIRSFWVPQAAGDSIRRPEPPAEEAAVKGRHVHGSGGRHQVATLLSLSPLTTLIAAILSAHHGSATVAWRMWRRTAWPCVGGRLTIDGHDPITHLDAAVPRRLRVGLDFGDQVVDKPEAQAHWRLRELYTE